MVIKVFQSLKKRSMPHVFEKLLMRAFQKYMTTPLLWQLKNFGHHLKNKVNRMAIENFRLPHTLSNFGRPLMTIENFYSLMLQGPKILIIPSIAIETF